MLADTDSAEPETHWLQGDIASRPFPIAVNGKASAVDAHLLVSLNGQGRS